MIRLIRILVRRVILSQLALYPHGEEAPTGRANARPMAPSRTMRPQCGLHPSRRREDAAPQDEGQWVWRRGNGAPPPEKILAGPLAILGCFPYDRGPSLGHGFGLSEIPTGAGRSPVSCSAE